MYMSRPAKTLNITEARRDLPKILRSVALGGGPVFVGLRGEGQAVIVKREEYEALRASSHRQVTWEDLRLEQVRPEEDLERSIADLRAENRAHLEARASKLTAPAPRRARNKPRRKQA